jgi:predicted nuclease of predicted toxin-antitoxin system
VILYLTDEHVPNVLVDGLRDRGVDVLRAVDVGLAATPDPDILEWAAGQDRILVTFDRKTVPGFAYDRVRNGVPMPGVIVLDGAKSLGAMIDELHLAAECVAPDGFRDRVVYPPL